ncbi:winged helix-turn-helix domain-containing protein [Candidatus Leptofilum sp.]|uniref:winged helix-turn-helix domain-containing protein n=1 Tax=Candidatus Leptofilum sp. TaxID=3241576 RepID=UPI003B5CE5C8
MTDFKQMLATDRLIHEPARLIIMALLYGVENADFTFLLRETGLTRGNLSFHLSKLEDGDYVAIEKTFKGKRPHTLCSLTENGRLAFDAYRQQLQEAANSLPE